MTIDAPVLDDLSILLTGRGQRHGMRLQKRGPVNQFTVVGANFKIVARVLQQIGFADLLLHLGSGDVFFLRLQKVLQIFDLAFETVIDQIVKMRAQKEPHARGKHELSHGEDRQIPEREPHADG